MLKKIQEDPTLRGVGCIILDEVHERDVNTDFVMLAIKQVVWCRGRRCECLAYVPSRHFAASLCAAFH